MVDTRQGIFAVDPLLGAAGNIGNTAPVKRGWSDEEQRRFEEEERARQEAQGVPQQPGNGIVQRTYDPIRGGNVDVSYGAGGNEPGRALNDPAQDEINRYRAKGEQAGGRQAFQLQFGAAETDRNRNLAAREEQIKALELQRQAAHGNAPSRAEIEGGQVASDALEGQLRAGAGARGPAVGGGSNIAAQRQGGQTLAGMASTSSARGAEMGRSIASYGTGAGAIRKGDLTMQQLDQRQAEAQGKQEMDQRRLGQQGQLGYEQLGVNYQQNQVDNSKRLAQVQNEANAAQNASKDARDARAMATFNAGTSLITKIGTSDRRAKSPAKLGALGLKGQNMLTKMSAEHDSLKYGSSVKNAPPSLGEDRDDELYASTSTARSKDGEHPSEEDTDELNDNPKTGLTRPVAGARTWGNGEDESKNESADTKALHAGIERSIKYGKDPEDVQDRPDPGRIELGIGSTPKGYAASRAGQPGDMFGGGPQKNTWDEDNEQAPGTRDVLKYGSPSERSERDMDRYSKAVMTSDAKAKEQAFLAGANAGAQHATSGTPGGIQVPPEYKASEEVNGSERKRGDTLANSRTFKDSTVQRKDPGTQRETVKNAEVSRDRSLQNATSALALMSSPSNLAMSGPMAALHTAVAADDGIDSKRDQARLQSKPVPPSYPMEPESKPDPRRMIPRTYETERTSDERAKDTDIELQKDANRKLKGETFTYKEGVGEDTGQVHHGQMAQTMMQNPITATAVREGEDGLKKVSEFDKLNVTAAGVASLQEQQDEMAGELEKMRARRNRRT